MKNQLMTEMSIKAKRNKSIEKKLNIEIINNQVIIKKKNPSLRHTIRLFTRINDFLLILF